MTITKVLSEATRTLQSISLFLLACLGVAVAVYTLASVAGWAPWLTLPLDFGNQTYPLAGQAIQIALTIGLVALAFCLPTSARVSALERSHRDFQISMDDVAKAYTLCHAADRAGLFTMSAEFDAVRERMAFLRDHPDLEALEPAVLEVAAQMSQQSRGLAEIYADEKVARAKAFLSQRQQEAEAQQARILEVQHTCDEIERWSTQVDAEEEVVSRQLDRLDKTLQKILPRLGYVLDHEDQPHTNIVPLPQKPAAE